MSTNFYIRTYVEDENQQRAWTAEEHIGKRSVGWVFQFCGLKQKTVTEWQARLNTLEGNEVIEDEYGVAYSPEDFWNQVQTTKEPWGNQTPKVTPTRMSISPATKRWVDNGFGFSGYEFC